MTTRIWTFLLAASLSSLVGCAGPMNSAVRDNDLKRLDALISQGSDINKPESSGFCTTPLMYAALNGQAEMVKELLKRGADVNRELPSPNGIGGSVLWCAIKPERENIVRILLDAGAQPSPALMDMVRNGVRHVGIKTMMEETDARLHGRTPAIAAPVAATPAAPAAAPASGLSATDIERIAKAVQNATPAAATPPVPTAALPPSPTPRFQLPERPDDLAVIVGVETYSELPKAAYAERDAEAVKAHLRALGVPERNTVLLIGSKASKSALEKNLEIWLPRMAKPESRVYFYFSGHGAPDVKTGQAYLVPWDGDPNFLESTAYPVKKLYEKLSALPAKQVLVAMDACFTGAGGRSVLASGARPLVGRIETGNVGGNITALTASAANEISGSLDGKGHGAFTYFFLEGLDGAGKNGSGHVTARSLLDYLSPHVKDEARRLNRDQTPQLIGADLILR